MRHKMALVWFSNIYIYTHTHTHLELLRVCVCGGGGGEVEGSATSWDKIPSMKKLFLHFLVSTNMSVGIISRCPKLNTV